MHRLDTNRRWRQRVGVVALVAVGKGQALMTYKPCRVHWMDTHSYPGWHKSHELDKLYTEPAPVMQSMGWLVHEDDKHVVLAQSVGEFAMGELLKIPRSLIVEMFIEKGNDDVPVGD